MRINLDLLYIHLKEIYYARSLNFISNLKKKITNNNDKRKIRNNIVSPRCEYTCMGFEIIYFMGTFGKPNTQSFHVHNI